MYVLCGKRLILVPGGHLERLGGLGVDAFALVHEGQLIELLDIQQGLKTNGGG